MERVAFLIERTHERLACLLNPENLVVKRRAGLRPRQSAGGLVTGAALSDDPVFFTGGGYTEITLNLLFDVSIEGSSLRAEDVRELTGPLWRLTENARGRDERSCPPTVRLVWGKSFNVRGVVSDVAERLEYFTAEGVPQRSWLRMRMQRVSESGAEIEGGTLIPPELPRLSDDPPPEMPNGPLLVHAIATAGDSDEGEDAPPSIGERLDQIAFRYYGDPQQWRALAWLNNIADPLRLAAGQVLQIATRSDVEEQSQ